VHKIRQLRPGHRQHRRVGRLSDREYLLWITMITLADDEGRLLGDAAHLRAAGWAYHPHVSVADVEAALQTLARDGLLTVYTVGPVRYAAFPSWKEHQKMGFPEKSRFPPPPAAGARTKKTPDTVEEFLRREETPP
jgi:hypothetical protein